MISSAPKTAFVLAGGGSYGAVQVGMLRELVRYGVRPDMIVGSSVGAINGAYFAAAPDAEGVERLAGLWSRLRRADVLPVTLRSVLGFLSRRNCLVDPSGLHGLLRRHLPYQKLEQARIPLHVVATDLLGGSEVCLSSGSAADAVLASASIPAAFPPVRLGEHYLVDGAVANNTPLSTAVHCGATRLIVLPTGFACSLERPPDGAIAAALHALNLLIARQLVFDMERLAGKVSVTVVPPLCPLATSPYDFSRAAELIGRAAESTRHWLERGGLERGGVPGALRPHSHADGSESCDDPH